MLAKFINKLFKKSQKNTVRTEAIRSVTNLTAHSDHSWFPKPMTYKEAWNKASLRAKVFLPFVWLHLLLKRKLFKLYTGASLRAVLVHMTLNNRIPVSDVILLETINYLPASTYQLAKAYAKSADFLIPLEDLPLCRPHAGNIKLSIGASYYTPRTSTVKSAANLRDFRKSLENREVDRPTYKEMELARNEATMFQGAATLGVVPNTKE